MKDKHLSLSAVWKPEKNDDVSVSYFNKELIRYITKDPSYIKFIKKAIREREKIKITLDLT